MNNDTIIEEMRVWTHREIDKALDKARADEREKVLDEVIKKLAESEDTMLSDKQYYTLMELKEQKNE